MTQHEDTKSEDMLNSEDVKSFKYNFTGEDEDRINYIKNTIETNNYNLFVYVLDFFDFTKEKIKENKIDYMILKKGKKNFINYFERKYGFDYDIGYVDYCKNDRSTIDRLSNIYISKAEWI